MTLTAEQLQLRRQGIGASEIGAVIGVNPWTAPIDIYLRKTGAEEPTPANDQTDFGHEIEPVICRLALRKLGLRDAVYGDTRVHPSEPCILATPDFLLPERPRTALQIKNVGFRVLHHWGEEPDDRGVPPYVLAQVQQEMEVFDLDAIIVAAWLGGRDHRLYEVQRDHELGAHLVAQGRRFWHEHVLAKVPPPVDGSASYDAYIRRRYPRGEDTTIEADADLVDLVGAYREACAAVGKAARLKRTYEQQIKERMGTATLLRGDDWRFTWREAAGRVSWRDVATEAGATAEMIERHRGPRARRWMPPRGWADEEDGE